MKRIFLTTLIAMGLVGCTTTTDKLAKRGSGRSPAMHLRSHYSCTLKTNVASKSLRLVYDGPGSNYAVGGYSHLYIKQQGSETEESLLAYQNFEEENLTDLLNERVGLEKLSLIFSVLSEAPPTTEIIRVPQPGEVCEAGTRDYMSSSYRAQRGIKIDAVNSEASQFGLQGGQEFVFDCDVQNDEPYTCGEDGRVPQP